MTGRGQVGLAEKKRNAAVIRLVEVLPGHKRQENEVKLEIVVHR
jgi:putative methionine-R-sulfoxide reductase with GAF domain